MTAGLQQLQSVGDRFTALKEELEATIDQSIRAERLGGLPGAARLAAVVGRRRERAHRTTPPCPPSPQALMASRRAVPQLRVRAGAAIRR